jgi:hypothetical protein
VGGGGVGGGWGAGLMLGRLSYGAKNTPHCHCASPHSASWDVEMHTGTGVALILLPHADGACDWERETEIKGREGGTPILGIVFLRVVCWARHTTHCHCVASPVFMQDGVAAQLQG